MTLEQQSEAERILLDCATTYYVASGLVRIADEPGYGPLREAREFIEKYGSDGAKAALDKYRRPMIADEREVKP